jgi:hypothetical protein
MGDKEAAWPAGSTSASGSALKRLTIARAPALLCVPVALRWLLPPLADENRFMQGQMGVSAWILWAIHWISQTIVSSAMPRGAAPFATGRRLLNFSSTIVWGVRRRDPFRGSSAEARYAQAAIDDASPLRDSFTTVDNNRRHYPADHGKGSNNSRPLGRLHYR